MSVRRILKKPALLLVTMAGLLVAGCETAEFTAAKTHWRQGVAYYEQGQQELAIREYNKAIALQPQVGSPFVGRGNSYLALGKVDLALRDFHRAVRLNTFLVQHRGHAYFSLGRFVEAAEDYRLRLRIAPKDSFAALFLYIAEVRSHKARTDSLARNAANLNMSKWPAPAVPLFLKKASPQQVLKSARNSGNQQRKMCDAYFFIGQWHLIRGDATKATQFFQKAVATGVPGQITWHFSKDELKRGVR